MEASTGAQIAAAEEKLAHVRAGLEEVRLRIYSEAVLPPRAVPAAGAGGGPGGEGGRGAPDEELRARRDSLRRDCRTRPSPATDPDGAGGLHMAERGPDATKPHRDMRWGLSDGAGDGTRARHLSSDGGLTLPPVWGLFLC